MSDDEYQQLLQKAREGDIAAFTTLFEANRYKVRAMVFKFLRNREDVNDVMTETYLTAQRDIPAFRGECLLYTWLTRVALNRARVMLRQRRRAPAFYLDHLDEYQLEITDVDAEFTPNDYTSEMESRMWELKGGDTPEALLNTADMAVALEKAVDDLPAEFRQVLEMREVDGMEYSTIARKLNISSGTVRSRLGRAKAALRRALEPYIDLENISIANYKRQE